MQQTRVARRKKWMPKAKMVQHEYPQLMPFYTDEQWAEKCAQRKQELTHVKTTEAYKCYIETLPREFRGDEDPTTPDPSDRVAKRQWNWLRKQWRLAVSKRMANHADHYPPGIGRVIVTLPSWMAPQNIAV